MQEIAERGLAKGKARAKEERQISVLAVAGDGQEANPGQAIPGLRDPGQAIPGLREVMAGQIGGQLGNNLAGGPRMSPQSVNQCGVKSFEMDQFIVQVIVNALGYPRWRRARGARGGGWNSEAATSVSFSFRIL